MERFIIQPTASGVTTDSKFYDVVDTSLAIGDVYVFETLALAEATAETLNLMAQSGAVDAELIAYMKSVPGVRIL